MKKIISILINFIFSFFRVKENTIIFESSRDRVDDNPYALYEYLKKNNKNEYKYKYIVSKDTDVSMLDKKDYAYYRTLKGYYYLATYKYFIKSQGTSSLLKKKKAQVYIYVTHGTLGLKKCGYDINGAIERPPLDYVKDFDYYIAPSNNDLKLFKSSTGYNNKSLIIGMPRSDKLIKIEQNKVDKIRKRLNLTDKKKKVVLYAPTFRDWEVEKNEVTYKINKLASIDNIYFVVTVHPLAKKLMKQYKLDDRIVDAIDYPDMNELLLVTDVLITDYSSAIFDFSLLNRPMVFYAYDYQKFVENRGNFYLNYKKDLPGPICYNEDELFNSIKNIDEIALKYNKKSEKFNQKYNECNDGKVCERFFKELDKITKKKENNQMTRTENSTKNMFTAFFNQILVILFRFVTRSVFIKCLGEQFLGINGLFSNILTLLSLADLGIGTALVYSLYKPIVDKDEERQIVIVNYLKKVYTVIGLVIITIGLLMVPFLRYIIDEEVNYINLNLVFLIYIFQTASSYLFFASYNEFLGANQKSYISNKINNIITVFSNIVQILVLSVFKNFYLYLITIIFFNILQAAIISKKTKQMYPFIKNNLTTSLTKEEKKSIFRDCGSLLIYRINYVVLTATDNVIISKYLGLATVGLYSNYVMITNSIVNVLSTFFNSITASIGNLHASKEEDKDYFIFKLINFITVVFFGIFSIGICVLINDFIILWIGEEYLLSNLFVVIVSINLYIEGLRKFLATYRTSYGLFKKARLVPIIGMITNIVVSIILVKRIGIFGVLIGTFISNLISFMWYDPYIIYKNVFKKSPLEYYFRNVLYFGLFVVIGYICKLLCDLIAINGILGFIIHGLICVFVPSIIIIILYYKSEYGQYLKYTVKKIIGRFLRRELN